MANAMPNPPPSSRQKRVLPSRSRRGGPGIGNCDVDLMILDAQKRRLDSEPLIPADTSFLLTTNSVLLEGSSTSSTFQLNDFARQRYFDRPEVILAYREQQLIQTPEFTLLPEDASVGGRFRPRSSSLEHDSAETSDAAYEKRHRKYETFEKRQRLREKEKLKHEQYKLKERIEQLSAMDSSAFLGLPATSFSLPPENFDEYGNYTSVCADGMTIPHNEGERRRLQMLEVASALEERYRTLLPSDKKLADLKSASRQSSVNLTSDTRPREEPVKVTTVHSNGSSIVLKIRVPQPRQKDNGSQPQPPIGSPELKSETLSYCSLSPSKPLPQMSHPEYPQKWPREYSDSPPSTPDRHTNSLYSVSPKVDPCCLVQWAERHRSAPNKRKTQRHVTAFGTKVPPEIEEVRDFEMPAWIRDCSPSGTSDGRYECLDAGAGEATVI